MAFWRQGGDISFSPAATSGRPNVTETMELVSDDGTTIIAKFSNDGRSVKTATTAYKVYRATLTQSGDGTTTATSGTLTVGVRYKITDYQTGDDFTNVGAAENTVDVEFIATGTTPADWTNTSELTDTSAPIATVLENTLGGELVWTRTALGSYAATLIDAFPDATKVFISNSSVVYISSGDALQLLTIARAGTHDLSIGTTDLTANLDAAEWEDVNAPIEIIIYY